MGHKSRFIYFFQILKDWQKGGENICLIQTFSVEEHHSKQSQSGKGDGYVVNNTYSTWQPSLTPERWIMLASSSPAAPAALKNKRQRFIFFLQLNLHPGEQVGVRLTQQRIISEKRAKSLPVPLDSTIWAEDSRKRNPRSNKDFTSTWMKSRNCSHDHQAVNNYYIQVWCWTDRHLLPLLLYWGGLLDLIIVMVKKWQRECRQQELLLMETFLGC